MTLYWPSTKTSMQGFKSFKDLGVALAKGNETKYYHKRDAICTHFFKPKHIKERLKVEAGKVDCAPFTYTLNSEAARMVIDCDWYKLLIFI